MSEATRSYVLSNAVVVCICLVLAFVVLALLAPMLSDVFNADSARHDAKVVCEGSITDAVKGYGEIIIAVKAAGRYYLFSYDSSLEKLREYASNPVDEISDESDIAAALGKLCEIADGWAIMDISEEMQRLPMNVRCFTGGRLKNLKED